MRQDKKIISQIVVVEGKSDTAKLKSIFDVETIETNGLNLSPKKMAYIKKMANQRGIILFLDPDSVGEKIRKMIMNNVDNAYNCFINKNDMKPNSKKIGIAEAKVEAIVDAFENILKFNKKNESISWNQYLNLNLNSKDKRLFLSSKLKISYANHKQMFKRLNMLNLKFEDISKILVNYK